MIALKRSLAAAELLLIAPAMLFMTALFVRNLQPQPLEPARSAQEIVMWYAHRPRLGLLLLLIALPGIVCTTGCIALARRWSEDAQLRRATTETLPVVRTYLAELIVGATTLASAAILFVVALHMLSD